ncbi:respiratory nitrate reductase subunit gamma [Streptomyces sp. NPDC087437]|uniref:respiratory nitrate reductase subunit gamma n=1 Tax=Streptomyces sp. NPDC087437 TaxID=3365789 RepID=UPI00380A87F9
MESSGARVRGCAGARVRGCAGARVPGRAVRAAPVGYLARLFTAGDPAQPLTTVAQAGTGGILLWVVLPYLALAPPSSSSGRPTPPWFRSVFALQPRPELMSGVLLLFQLHALSALLLFAAWPFTRLAHMLTATAGLPHPPLHRPPQPRAPPRRGWERIG